MSFFRKNNLFSNLAKIFSATVLAQAVTLAFSPVFTRLYLPEAFGLLAFVLSVSNPFSSFSTFRLEQAVVLPKEKSEANNIANVVIFINTFFSIFLFVFIIAGGETLFEKNVSTLVFIPLIVLVSGFQMPLNSWLQREKKYTQIAHAKLIQTISIAIFSILSYWINNNLGLLIGYLIGWIVYSWYMYFQARKNDFKFQFSNFFNAVKSTLINYKEFPVYHTLPSVAVSFTLSIPVFYFNTWYSETEMGWFNFSRQLLLVPVSLVTAAFSQVYYARVVELKNHQKKVFPEFIKLIQLLFIIALAMFLLIHFGGEFLFVMIFGDNWAESGNYASVLVISAALQLIVWPLNTLPVALGKIKYNSLLQTAHFLLTLSLYFIKNVNTIEFIYFVVAIDAVFYTSYFLFILYQVKVHDKA
ncbi:MAG: oligosaccharide flippase family protein [Bacteroidia bacterium]